MKFTVLFALVAVSSGINLRQTPAGPGGSADTWGDGKETDATYKKVTSDPTGTYTPKGNMWTGFEGAGTGH